MFQYTQVKCHVFHISLVGNGEKVQKPMEKMQCVSSSEKRLEICHEGMPVVPPDVMYLCLGLL